MQDKGLANRKIDAKTFLIVLIIVAIPSFFWFRYLYDMYVVDKVSPEMAKMRGAMMQPRPSPSAASGPKSPSKGPGEKGEKQTHP
jgi:hypothetical protein